ncbi:MAG: arylesterase [Bryobacter sp.]|nr:arylesterase [Bryobacter sp.]
MRLFSFFTLTLLLLGCGTQTDTSPKAETATKAEPLPPPVPADTRPVIACFGDSLTAGYGLEAGSTYPDALQKLLDSSGYSYRVVNLGISGDTTQGALDRIQTVVEYAPKITVVEIGGNDGLRGIPVARSRDNLTQIVARAKNAGSKVLLAGITLPPNYGREYIGQFEQMYATVAKSSADAFLPFVLDGIWNAKGMMQNDGIHPTAPGAERMAQNVFKALEPLLEK